jgi:tRNA pseudouridine38-40 synthase
MAEAARRLEGTHDFSSFRAQGCSARHPVRTLEKLRVLAIADEVHLTAEGTGFLRHMVRILAGTLTEVGLSRRPTTWAEEVLRGRDRALAGRTAPAHGLTLERIVYRPEP